MGKMVVACLGKELRLRPDTVRLFETASFKRKHAGILALVDGLRCYPTTRFLRRHDFSVCSAVGDQTDAATQNVVSKPPSTNLILDEIKNMRDLSTASQLVSISSSKIFRTGCVSKASETDVS
jgi:hypothetical protein